MKKIILGFILCFSLFPFLQGQNQSLYFEGAGQCAEFSTPPGLPAGNDARTVTFWLRSDMGESPSPIVELGVQDQPGSAFGIFTQGIGGKIQLCFWGHYEDKASLGEITDDNWHFVAITYNNNILKCYIDGELRSANTIKAGLKTKTGNKCYIGGFPPRGWYYKGAVDNLSVWKGERTKEQIQKDMVMQYGDLKNLVVYFGFDEGKGTAFSNSLPQLSTARVPTGAIPVQSSAGKFAEGGKVRFTTAVAQNPTLLDKGIWFLIQNKADINNDFEMPARNLAIRAGSGSSIDLAQVPMEGKFDDFLWSIQETSKGNYQLFNKRLGAINSSLLKVLLPGNNINATATWQIALSNKNLYGTNAYTLTFDNKKLQSDNKKISLAPADNPLKQVWLFQPMALVSGYHIPNAPQAINSFDNDKKLRTDITSIPFSRMLKLDNNINLLCSNTCTEWVILNHHLIAANMMNAIRSDKKMNAGLADNSKPWRKEIVITSWYDSTFGNYNYPLVTDVYPIADILPLNGSHGYDPGRNIWCTFVSELITGKVANDGFFRGFDHITHEFGHGIANGWESDQFSTPPVAYQSSASERFAIASQAFFNNNWSYIAAPAFRHQLKELYKEQYDYISKTFDVNSSWMPPRIFRRPNPLPNIPVKIASGTVINYRLANQAVLQSDFGNSSLWINRDGNTLFSRIADGKFGKVTGNILSYQDSGIPLNPKEIKFVDGQLLYIYDNSVKVFAGTTQPVRDKKTFLVMSSDNEKNARLKVIDDNGNTLWQSNSFYK